MELIKRLLTTWIGRTVLVVMMLPAVAFLYLKATGRLNPGPVSAMARQGTELGGYTSHAEFEKECKHCHAPVHCLTPGKCQSCHLEIAKERAGTEGLHAMLPGTDRCQTCHKEHRGREAIITQIDLTHIDHEALTGFSLAAHTAVEAGAPVTCEDCHPDGVLAATNVDCQGCHLERDTALAQAHVDQYGTDCTLCHDGQGDGAVLADHALYPLDGAHADAACDSCHADRAYAGVATDCASCHEEPDYHAGQFGTDCARCHSAIAWAPAQLTQHTFHLDHGTAGPDSAEPVPCTTCHPNTYTEHTCYGCHDHDPAAVLALHDAAGMEDIEACGECHKTGLADELDDLRPVAAEPLASASEGASVEREEP